LENKLVTKGNPSINILNTNIFHISPSSIMNFHHYTNQFMTFQKCIFSVSAKFLAGVRVQVNEVPRRRRHIGSDCPGNKCCSCPPLPSPTPSLPPPTPRNRYQRLFVRLAVHQILMWPSQVSSIHTKFDMRFTYLMTSFGCRLYITLDSMNCQRSQSDSMRCDTNRIPCCTHLSKQPLVAFGT